MTPSPACLSAAVDHHPVATETPRFAPPAPPDAPKTFGERTHRFLQNVVINHGLNLAISFAFAHAAKFGGNNFLAKGIHALDGKAAGMVKRFPSLKIPVSILWLSSGGTVLMPVVRGMDETKIKLSMVKRFDRWHDVLRGREADAAEWRMRDAAYNRIEQEIHPGWGRTFVARLSGILFNIGTEITLMKAHHKLLPVPGASVEDDYGYGWFGKKVVEDFEKAGRPLAPGSNGEWWARNVPLEVLSTVNAVAFYNTAYRWFQKKDETKRAESESAPALATPILFDAAAGAEDRHFAAAYSPARKPRPEARAPSHAEQTLRDRREPSLASLQH